jgi:hypothetical protein
MDRTAPGSGRITFNDGVSLLRSRERALALNGSKKLQAKHETS